MESLFDTFAAICESGALGKMRRLEAVTEEEYVFVHISSDRILFSCPT